VFVAQTEPMTTDMEPVNRRPETTIPEGRALARLPGVWLAILAGALLWLACPPVTAWLLAWVALVPLILSVTTATRLWQALWRGYVFGWVYLGAVWYWIGLTIVAWTQSPIGWAAWFGLTLVMAIFYAVWGGAAWWLARRIPFGGLRLFALAAAWVVMEWARTLGALSMPWAQLSYTQYRFLPILQIADLTGAYGVSFLLALVNGAIAAWWQDRREGRRLLAISLTLTVLAGLYGYARLAQPNGSEDPTLRTPIQTRRSAHRQTSPLLTVALMQGNFPVYETAEDVPRELQTFEFLTQEADNISQYTRRGHPSLYVWSESAAPEDALHDPATRETLTALARNHHGAVLVGSRLVDPVTGAESNASVLFLPNGAEPTVYRKQQLVPFGEFIPFRRYLPAFLNETFHFFDTDVTPGEGATALRIPDLQGGTVALGPFICYESVYPQYPRTMTRAGANLLVTQSNDAWFHSRAAMEQHLAAVILRAIENGRPVARATTNGITCLMDARGRILTSVAPDEATFQVYALPLTQEATLYTRLGDWFVALCGLIVLGASGVGRWALGKPKAQPLLSDNVDGAR